MTSLGLFLEKLYRWWGWKALNVINMWVWIFYTFLQILITENCMCGRSKRKYLPTPMHILSGIPLTYTWKCGFPFYIYIFDIFCWLILILIVKILYTILIILFYMIHNIYIVIKYVFLHLCVNKHQYMIGIFVIVLSVLLWYTDSDYSFGIFKFFL